MDSNKTKAINTCRKSKWTFVKKGRKKQVELKILKGEVDPSNKS